MALETFEQFVPQLAEKVYVAESAVVIGDVTLDQEVSVWPYAVIRGDIHSIKIGARSNVQDGTIIHVTHAGPFNPKGFPVSIGEDVIIGHQAVLHGCTIANKVLVGIGARILDGAVINSNTIIGAGSLVPPGKHLESGFLWLGNPVKKIRPISNEELEFIDYSTRYYVNLAQKYRQK